MGSMVSSGCRQTHIQLATSYVDPTMLTHFDTTPVTTAMVNSFNHADTF